MSNLIKLNHRYAYYGIAMAVLIFLLKWLEYQLLIVDHATEIYVGIIALLFTAVGIWLALRLTKPKIQTMIVREQVLIKEDEKLFVPSEGSQRQLGLSKREMEVLQLMANGLSNQQIAEYLFVSLNTIKTHSSNVYIKMDVKRRTQAVDKARKLGLVA